MTKAGTIGSSLWPPTARAGTTTTTRTLARPLTAIAGGRWTSPTGRFWPLPSGAPSPLGANIGAAANWIRRQFRLAPQRPVRGGFGCGFRPAGAGQSAFAAAFGPRLAHFRAEQDRIGFLWIVNVRRD